MEPRFTTKSQALDYLASNPVQVLTVHPGDLDYQDNKVMVSGRSYFLAMAALASLIHTFTNNQILSTC
jgi:hypothetical protein